MFDQFVNRLLTITDPIILNRDPATPGANVHRYGALNCHDGSARIPMAKYEAPKFGDKIFHSRVASTKS